MQFSRIFEAIKSTAISLKYSEVTVSDVWSDSFHSYSTSNLKSTAQIWIINLCDKLRQILIKFVGKKILAPAMYAT